MGLGWIVVVIGQATVGEIEAGAFNMCDTAQTRRIKKLYEIDEPGSEHYCLQEGKEPHYRNYMMQAALESLLHLIDQVEYINSGKPESDDYILSFNILLENATNKKELEEFHRLKAQKEAMGTNMLCLDGLLRIR
ncbi:hypothetical protein Tco_1249880 [Tanacetum coccineum]